MENNIANISEMSNEQIMEAIGQDDGSSKGVNIPRLGINRSPEDDDGNATAQTSFPKIKSQPPQQQANGGL